MKIFFALLITGALLFIAYVRYLENTTVFHPSSTIAVTPQLLDLEFEDVYFLAPDGPTLNGWFIKSSKTDSTLIYFHGNAGNIGDRLEKVSLFHQLGLNIFIIDYRGYGKSQGRPSEEGIYLDALAAFDYLLTRKDVDPNKIVLYGDSLGGVVAVDLASKRKVASLIIDSSFSCAADMSKMIFPFVPTFLLKTKMDSIPKVKRISVPKLFIHSPDDEVVPFRLGRKLFDAAIPPKEFLQTQGRHNDNHIESQDTWIKGVTRYLPSPQPSP